MIAAHQGDENGAAFYLKMAESKRLRATLLVEGRGHEEIELAVSELWSDKKE